MANDEGMTKIERQNKMRSAPLLFEHSGFIRHSSFVLRHSNSPWFFVRSAGRRT
jgi:hypothetical protein